MKMILLAAAVAAGTMLALTAKAADKLVPFPEFLHHVEHAEATDYLHKPGVAVKDAAAFEKMRAHILNLYRGVHVQHSYSSGGQTIDCVPVDEQPSMRRPAAKEVSTTPVSPVNSSSAKVNPAVTIGTCATGTIPMRRLTLEELTRSVTLEDYLHKASHGNVLLPPAKP